jgi:hypothetical protein
MLISQALWYASVIPDTQEAEAIGLLMPGVGGQPGNIEIPLFQKKNVNRMQLRDVKEDTNLESLFKKTQYLKIYNLPKSVQLR